MDLPVVYFNVRHPYIVVVKVDSVDVHVILRDPVKKIVLPVLLTEKEGGECRNREAGNGGKEEEEAERE